MEKGLEEEGDEQEGQMEWWEQKVRLQRDCSEM